MRARGYSAEKVVTLDTVNVPDVPTVARRDTAREVRRCLDQAIDAALPLSGGRVRPLLLALRRELDHVDERRADALPDPHAHACVSCSPDGIAPGPGCINCRQTGMDQTPCRAAGHVPQCPHGCCGGPRTNSTSVEIH